MQGKYQCVKCRNTIPAGTIYCPFCGTEQQGDSESTQGNRKRKNHNVQVVGIGNDTMVPVEVPGGEKITSVKADEKEDEGLKGKTKKPVGKEKMAAPETEGEAGPEGASDSAEGPNADKPAADGSTGGPEATEDEDLPKIDTGTVEEPQEKKKGGRLSRAERGAEYDRTHDSLTKLQNRVLYDEAIAAKNPDILTVILIDASHTEQTYAEKGNIYGDTALIVIAKALGKVFGDSNCYRTDKFMFAVLLSGISVKLAEEYISTYRKTVESDGDGTGLQLDIRIAAGCAAGGGGDSTDTVLRRAGKAVEEEKKRMAQVYNPNYDRYYDDVVAEFEELQVEYDRENIHKAVMVVVALVVFLILYAVFIL